MRIITGRENAGKIYQKFAEKNISMLAPCCENAGQIEGILMGAQSFAERNEIEELPINIGFTANYPEYSNLHRASVGCKVAIDGSLDGGNPIEGFDMMMGYLRSHIELASSHNVIVLPFLDHGQPTADKEILENPKRLSKLALVMIDNSFLSFEENMAKTREYVKKFGREFLIEAQLDRIYTKEQALTLGITRNDMITSVAEAVKYVKNTKVDFIVPNLGTEHRVTSEEGYVKKYERQRAQEISSIIGKRICLHGTSCLGKDIRTLPNDGIIKVNVFTRMSIESGKEVYHIMKDNEKGILKESQLHLNSASFRNYLTREKVAEITIEYLESLNYRALSENQNEQS
jgi:fructose-bisphosphate aldolase class II